MEDIDRPAKIIAQAAQWSFEGDCSLLAWMQELSQNLEQRATATNNALQQLSINVNRTATALDNAANSLTALQYTQFVESRCHDDDETVPNTSVVVPEEVVTTNGKTKSSTEMMETFLRKNLELLHNSHEKYALDFDDSDEDENGAASNYIYQPKNPYNDALLPHIYGSKLWKEHWHVGLCDGSNEYSGDEASDAFSESPSSSATDNESYESNTANLSEWASSSSIPIEHKHPAQMPTHNESKNIAVETQEKRLPSNDESDTYSTTSRSTTTNPQIKARDQDLFANLRHESPATSTSISSSPHRYSNPPSAAIGQSQRNVAPSSTMLPPLIDAVPPSDMFADTTAVQQPIVNRVNSSLQNQTIGTQNKRFPVNLFDDDDFNSFMTEAVDQPQPTVEPPAQLPIPAVRNLPANKEKPSTGRISIDLFAENMNEEWPVLDQQRVSSRAFEPPKEVKGRKPINLFDSPEGSPPSDTLFSTDRERDSSVVAPVSKPIITAKSLFDDDEEDDDFLNVFGSKKPSLSHKITGNTLLFDGDGEDIISATKQTSRLTSNLFDETLQSDQVSSAITAEKDDTKEASGIPKVKESHSSPSLQKNTRGVSAVDLFDDLENEVTRKTVAISTEKRVEEKAPSPPSNLPTNKVLSLDLFEDDDTNDLNELLRQQSSQNRESIETSVPVENTSQTKEPKNLPKKESIPQKAPLFMDEFEDDDDLFSKSLTKAKTNEPAYSIKGAKIIEPAEPVATIENKQISNKPVVAPFKSSSLFADDFDDDLFGVKSTTQVISKTARTENKEDDLGSKRVNLLPNATKQSSSQAKITEPPTTIFESNTAGSSFLKSAIKPTPGITSKEMDKSVEQDHHKVPDSINTASADLAQQPEGILATTTETNVETNSSTLDANKNEEKVSEINYEQPQNVIPVVASTRETISISTAADMQTTPQYAIDSSDSLKYSRIFLDEPPDDDDFFTTLTNNSKQMSISKLTLDLENDFYEPALPAAPINVTRTTNSATGTNTQNEGSNKQEQSSSDYGGLRLFSEIPPDDDEDEDFSFVLAPTKHSAENASINQRLHNVFYDDFSETLAAVQQMKEKKEIAHALFEDEPPADEEQFDIVGKVPRIQQEEMQGKAEAEKVRNLESDKVGKTAIASVTNKDETDRAVQNVAEKTGNSAAGKLQMPNIKINVQALLPGGGGRPSFKKTPTQHASELPKPALDNPIEIPKTPTDLHKDPTKAAVSASTSSETLLPSVCKSRVRVPAGRRPSTRRARQEKYRQSLIADQLDYGDVHGSHDNSTQSNSSSLPTKEQIDKTPQLFSNKPAIEVASNSAAARVGSIKPPQTNLFVEDDDGIDDLLFNPSKKNVDLNAKSSLPNSISDHTPKEQVALPAEDRNKTLPRLSKGVSDDESDDLFKSVRVAPITINQATITNTHNIKAAASNATTTKITNTKSLFGTPSSDESEDDLFRSSQKAKAITKAEKLLPKASATTTTAANVNAQPKRETVISNNNKLDSIFASDDEYDDDFLSNLKTKSKITTKLSTTNAKQVPASSGGLFSDVDSDEDDLFGGKSKPKQVAIKEKTAAQKSTNSKPLSTANNPPTTLADNPLADLLKP